jgi:hypothetical protein
MTEFGRDFAMLSAAELIRKTVSQAESRAFATQTPTDQALHSKLQGFQHDGSRRGQILKVGREKCFSR